jgi:hypothetical protein
VRSESESSEAKGSVALYWWALVSYLLVALITVLGVRGHGPAPGILLIWPSSARSSFIDLVSSVGFSRPLVLILVGAIAVLALSHVVREKAADVEWQQAPFIGCVVSCIGVVLYSLVASSVIYAVSAAWDALVRYS